MKTRLKTAPRNVTFAVQRLTKVPIADRAFVIQPRECNHWLSHESLHSVLCLVKRYLVLAINERAVKRKSVNYPMAVGAQEAARRGRYFLKWTTMVQSYMITWLLRLACKNGQWELKARSLAHTPLHLSSTT